MKLSLNALLLILCVSFGSTSVPFRFAGTAYNVYSFDSQYATFNYDRLQKAQPGASCLHAHAGKMLRNDEIIVYKEEQCTVKYLIELTN